MIQNYIFDIGNVLVDFHPIPFFEQRYPNQSMKDVCAVVFDDEWEQLDQGNYTCEELQQMKLTKYPYYHEQIRWIFQDWMDMMVEKEASVAYLKELKAQGNNVYLLSNIGIQSHHYLSEKYDFFDCADGMILSYQHHMLKPDIRIYQLLLDTFQLKGKECIFFDDRSQNIERAQVVGIHGICFHDVAQVKKEVNAYVNNK